MQGLTEAEATRRRSRFGPNRLPKEPPTPVWRRFLDAVRAPLVLLLFAALAFDLAAWLFEGAEGVPIEAIAIATIVLLNAGLEVLQGARAERAIAALEDLATPVVAVWRDGTLVERPSVDLVPGDRVVLQAGARVPADGTLLVAEGVRLDTSALTGESVPEDRSVGEDVAAGTTVVAGRAEVRVTATGPDSAIGRLATLLGGIDRSATPLQKRLARFGRRVAQGALLLAAVLVAAGLSLGGDPVETLLLAVALTVAAVPEGLPAVVTGALALGTQRMARRKAVVRRLAAVETLGSVTLIASDKTGTLTRNEMEVACIDATDAGGGGPRHDVAFDDPSARSVLRAAVLASDVSAVGDVGDPIERAVLRAAAEVGLDVQQVRRDAPRTSSRPFDAAWAYLRATVRENGDEVSYVKGAPEAVLARCDMTEATRGAWEAEADRHAEAGERTLLVARGSGEREEGWQPLGLIAFRDPPREAAPEAVRAAQAAGARLVMITGDHPATARAIAEEVGMPAGRVARGDEIAELQAANDLASVDVFARTAPERKLDLVTAFQEAGHTVAMTGDGVNDGPALRRADVGVAMGERGSDVAREAADVVLLDDDIATLIAAIEEGRGVAANLRAFVRFLFAANLAEVITVAGGFALALAAASGRSFTPPLTAAQILWINLVTDALPALALALDRRPGVMEDAPRAADAPLLSGGTLPFVLLGGIVVAALSLAPLAWMPAFGSGSAESASVTFMVLVLGQLALVDGARRERHTPERNVALLAALGISVALQVAAVSVAPLRTLLGLAPLPAWAWLGVLASVLVAWGAGRILAAVWRRS